MRLRLNTFKGEIPRVNKTLLPDGHAQASVDADHSSGAIEPIRKNVTAHTAATVPADFYLHKGTDWLTFTASVDVVPGPTVADRLYISKAGADPYLKVMPAGTEYPLAIPTPSAPPTTSLETDTSFAGASQEPYDAALTNTEFVTAVYNDILGRDPDPAGLTFWVGHLDAANVTRAEFIDEVERSSENILPPRIEDEVFVYTWVSIFDEESLPSPPSTALEVPEGSTVRITFIDQPPTGSRIDRLRVYRTQSSNVGSTEFQFVKELNSATTAYVHDVSVDQPQEVLPSTYYDPPVTGLQGFTALQGGVIAGFKGKSVQFCEPYRPHAWPGKYELITDYDVVALVAFGPILAILTTGTPYIAQGNSPESMVMERIEQNMPCVSADGVVDMGYAAAYPSPDGLVTLSQSGAQIVTKPLFSREQWAALAPETISAGQVTGKYVFSYQRAGAGSREAAIIDLTGQTPFLIRSTLEATHLRDDVYTGSLHYIKGDTSIREFASVDAGYSAMRWKSAQYHLPTLTSFGAILIDGEKLSDPSGFIAKIYRDGVEHASITTISEPMRVPPGLGRRWEVEVEGTARIERITLAGDIAEIWS
ncbi:DUF4214 domain-containing protein [Sediminimonas sp.]|uniref:DUF4214 domain-containing protein n=1 Tax=Sediminimonas sp. TaxID=2823379 RepID=UPI0025DE2499|nr:DUF4214 domain-containing protein [Sediminimonas sp.]